MTEPLILCDNLVKIYKIDAIEVVALQGLDLKVQPNEVMALVGSSGSGKTTLMNVLGGLDRPSAGRVIVAGNDLLKLSDMALNDYRRRMVGFVWQQKARNLIPYLQVEQNIEMPMIMSGVGQRARREWVKELISAVGLTTRRGHKLAQLSGGEQQRVAIAVALANRPALLLADEPTGELDSSTASTIFELFHTLNRTFGLTVVIVSHDPNVARHVERVVAIRDGKTSSETVRRSRGQGSGDRGQENGDADPSAAGQAEQHEHVFEELMMLDSAGRLQVPKEVRERYGIGDRVHMEETAEGLLLRPVAGTEEPVRRLAPADEPPPRKVGRLGRVFNRVRGRS
jgi:ABC-type lipoprotein export system ATPase subunit/bifunctional DNA-binding transcriptional regulator/antitoxin component of YhaV-PrlF toxin-antitoxin module